MKPIYNIPVIPQNLQREETVLQIAEALNYLKQVSDDILTRVNTRISSNNQHLTSISKRVDVVCKKVDKLSDGAKKATQVFSSSKYPATEVKKRYVSIFNEATPIQLEKITNDTLNTKQKTRNKDQNMEQLLFYHVKVKEDDIKAKKQNQGLGEIPSDINSINDLLLFNSHTNPYNKYVMTDPLQGAKYSNSNKKGEGEEKEEIGAAPVSIIDKNALSKMRNLSQSFSYNPDLGEVPTLDVPTHLPDLPGIADDLCFNIKGEKGPTIAPSSLSTTPNKPNIHSEEKEEKEEETTTKNSKEKEEENVKKQEMSTSIKEKSQEKEEEEIVDKVEIKQDNVNVIVKKEKKEEETKKPVSIDKIQVRDEVKEKEVTDSSSDNARANLMEAIRKAGGKAKSKLKSPDVKQEQQKQEKQEKIAVSSGGGGDLMSDLYAKLAMRRKGISGSKAADGGITTQQQQQQQKGQIESGSVMHKVSAMIPPPPQKTANDDDDDDEEEDNNTNTDEWDD